MEWLDYYRERPRPLSSIARNLFAHRALLDRVASNGVDDQRPVLEIGTGTGELSAFLAWNGLKVVSIDHTIGLLIDASKHPAERAFLSAQDAFALGFRARTFSTAFSQGFFEHFSDGAVVALLREQLRVADRVVFSIPSRWYPGRDLGDERLLRLSDWREILEPFRVVEAFYYGLSSRRLRTAFRRRAQHILLSVSQKK